MAYRMAEIYKSEGHDVFFIRFGDLDRALSNKMAQVATLVECGDDWWDSGDSDGMQFDWTHCFAGDALLWCMIHSAVISFGVKTVGIYHPRQFVDKFPWGFSLAARRTAKYIDDGFALPVYMNEVVAASHSGLIKTSGAVIPIPVSISQGGTAWKRGKVVSVGRLVSFKNYHTGVIDAIASDSTDILEYHIIGDGPLMNDLRRYVDSKGVAHRVKFYGKVDYSQFKDVLADAWVFAGMGTSLVEASGCAVPSLVAVESDGRTYGIFSEYADYCVGEVVPARMPRDWGGELSRLLLMSAPDYIKLKRDAILRADAFNGRTVCLRYLSYVKAQPKVMSAPVSFIWGVVYRLEASFWAKFSPAALRHK